MGTGELAGCFISRVCIFTRLLPPPDCSVLPARCEECLATTPNACLRLEVEILEHELEMAEAATSQAVSDKEAVDDGVGGVYVSVCSCVRVSFFGGLHWRRTRGPAMYPNPEM